MSVMPLGSDAAQTAATSVPFAASETFAFVRPATDNVTGDVLRAGVCAAGAANITAHRSVPAGTTRLVVRRVMAPLLEPHPKRELHRSRIADGGDLVEGRRWTPRIGAAAKVSDPSEVVASIREVEGFGNPFQANGSADPERAAHTKAHAEKVAADSGIPCDELTVDDWPARRRLHGRDT